MPNLIADPARAAWTGGRCRGVLLLLASLVLGATLGGCTKARAEVEPEMPALAVPPPPPRVLPPLEGAPMDAAAPASAEPQTRSRPPQPRSDPARAGANGSGRTDARPDPTAAPPTAADAGPPSDTPSAPSTPALQLAPVGDAASEQNTRRRLAQAEKTLLQVDYRLLNTDAKAQYDTAKRFIVLAEQAIVERNLLFAHTLADKAATIAGVLQRR